MTLQEFSDQFDLLYNNITSNQAPGLNEYEKSVFLTKAEKEIVKNYFTANSKGNTIGQGFDDSAKRQADFSILMETSKCSFLCAIDSFNEYIFKVSGAEDVYGAGVVVKEYQGSGTVITLDPGTYTVTVEGIGPHIVIGSKTYSVSGTNVPVVDCQMVVKAIDKLDARSAIYQFPSNVFIMVNETLSIDHLLRQVIPLRYDEYTRLMSKPYKRPLKNQVWRLMNSGNVDEDGHSSAKMVEIVCGPEVKGTVIPDYKVRYIRVPAPIIVGELDGLTIDGYEYGDIEVCEVDPILHEDILQRAVELAKAAWSATGQDNTQAIIQTGQRSE